eukprot:CAMPEP_0182865588 /NCGR_PEP_ID=MMETSP0034_2-20130328/7771_1 /TAXON_ID=156128 /ORGANISM="Nephroselmis pyriformis, Strain CCMP717" /LENGTH=73 /DNA_ID=CAMNT_0024997897 /DNA_START=133 /DNA_END=350 /DNA_ORIENTATION=+
MSQRSNGIVKVPRRFEEVLARNEEWIQSGNLVEDNPEFGRKPSNAFREYQEDPDLGSPALSTSPSREAARAAS